MHVSLHLEEVKDRFSVPEVIFEAFFVSRLKSDRAKAARSLSWSVFPPQFRRMSRPVFTAAADNKRWSVSVCSFFPFLAEACN